MNTILIIIIIISILTLILMFIRKYKSKEKMKNILTDSKKMDELRKVMDSLPKQEAIIQIRHIHSLSLSEAIHIYTNLKKC